MRNRWLRAYAEQVRVLSPMFDREFKSRILCRSGSTNTLGFES